MKKALYILCLLAMLTPAGFAAYNRWFAEHKVVILSTNDIHSHIANFPRLASAVERCRDTVACILVDAGDRWTGSSFVDLAPEPRKPIIDLMNKLGFEVATFGNHEFDAGRDFLRDMMQNYRFETVCANIRSTDGQFPEVAPYTIRRVGGIDIGFVGVVTNFQNNHPEGNDASFAGLEFPDATVAAREALVGMKPRCEVAVIISHLGYPADTALLNRITDFDFMISGHSHLVLDGTDMNGTLVGQTGKNLDLLGVTTIRTRGKKIKEISYRNVELKNYPLDPEYQADVERILADPYLGEKMGYNASALDIIGMADMHTTLIKRATGADIGFYHKGGLRISELPADSISRGTLIDADIFMSHIYTLEMTPAQMRKMIVSKYNGPVSSKESHRIDLFSTEPYTIICTENDEAKTVVFPTLQESRKYKVAICSYVYENYKDIEGENEVYYGDRTVPEIFIEYFRNNSPVHFSNEAKQFVRRTGE